MTKQERINFLEKQLEAANERAKGLEAAAIALIDHRVQWFPEKVRNSSLVFEYGDFTGKAGERLFLRHSAEISRERIRTIDVLSWEEMQRQPVGNMSRELVDRLGELWRESAEVEVKP